MMMMVNSQNYPTAGSRRRKRKSTGPAHTARHDTGAPLSNKRGPAAAADVAAGSDDDDDLLAMAIPLATQSQSQRKAEGEGDANEISGSSGEEEPAAAAATANEFTARGWPGRGNALSDEHDDYQDVTKTETLPVAHEQQRPMTSQIMSAKDEEDWDRDEDELSRLNVAQQTIRSRFAIVTNIDEWETAVQRRCAALNKILALNAENNDTANATTVESAMSGGKGKPVAPSPVVGAPTQLAMRFSAVPGELRWVRLTARHLPAAVTDGADAEPRGPAFDAQFDSLALWLPARLVNEEDVEACRLGFALFGNSFVRLFDAAGTVLKLPQAAIECNDGRMLQWDVTRVEDQARFQYGFHPLRP